MKRFLLIALVITGLAGTIALYQTAPALAAAKDEICSGVGAVSGTGSCSTKAGEPTVNSVINTAVNVLSLIVGIASIIMVIYAGFKYVTSAGDSGNIASAKNTLIYAIVGIVVAALARPIVQFVLDRL